MVTNRLREELRQSAVDFSFEIVRILTSSTLRELHTLRFGGKRRSSPVRTRQLATPKVAAIGPSTPRENPGDTHHASSNVATPAQSAANSTTGTRKKSNARATGKSKSVNKPKKHGPPKRSPKPTATITKKEKPNVLPKRASGRTTAEPRDPIQPPAVSGGTLSPQQTASAPVS